MPIKTTSEELYNIPPQPQQTCPLIDEIIMGISDKLGDVAEIARDLEYGQEQLDLIEVSHYEDYREQLNELRKQVEDIREWGQMWKNIAKKESVIKTELLDRYTTFLLKNGYVDTDVVDEGSAIDEFLRTDRP